MALTKTEFFHIAKLLDELSDRYGNDGCNDMSIANTTQNAQMLRCMIRCNGMGEEEQASDLARLEKTIHDGKEEIIINNSELCDYLLGLVKKEAGIKDD